MTEESTGSISSEAKSPESIVEAAPESPAEPVTASPGIAAKPAKAKKPKAEKAKSPRMPKLPKADSKKTAAEKTEPKAGKAGQAKAAAKKPAKAKPIKTAKSEPAKSKPTKKKPTKSGLEKTGLAKPGHGPTARMLDSKVVYEGKLFRVLQDHIIEPGGRESRRDVIRHNGSVVILAIDPGKRKKDPWVVIERQYRHAAGQYLWELPAGKLDAGESALEGAKRELAEETGYSAKKWTPLVEYFASPGFLGESMKVFLAEELVAGDAHPEEDEHIDFRLVKLSEILEMADKGKIIDGKTLTSILIYARNRGIKPKK